MASDYVVTVDGGGGERNQAGPCYCSVLFGAGDGSWTNDIETCDLPHCKSNNEGEYAAVIAGLEIIKEWMDTNAFGFPGGITVLVRSDSELVVKQCRGEYRVKAANLKPFHARVMELVQEFKEVRFEWVTGKEMKRILGH
jgi:ribonuclease HI